MEVYIEVVLINNFTFCFLLLWLTQKILRRQCSVLRKILSSMAATVATVLLPLVVLPNLVSLLVKVCIGIIMQLIAFKEKSIKGLLLNFFTFCLATAVLGGLCFGFMYMWTGSFDAALTGAGFPIPMWIVFLILAVFLFILFQIIETIYRKKKTSHFIFPIELCEGENSIRTNAFLDSGNALSDPDSGKPIVVVNFKIFQKLFEVPLEKIIRGKVSESEICGAKYISFSTLNSKGKILVAPVQKLTIHSDKTISIHPNPLIGLSFLKGFSGGCHALLSQEFFG